MPRIQPVAPETARGEAKEIFDATQQKMGMIPNIVRTMANAPAVANAYLAFSGAVAGGNLSPALRERIALAVGQANECRYCLSAHTAIGKKVGLAEDEILAAREGSAPDARDRAAVELARRLVDQRGNVSDAEIATARSAGLNDGDISEIVANVALNLFTNYFNHVSDPEIDFPVAPELAAVAQ